MVATNIMHQEYCQISVVIGMKERCVKNIELMWKKIDALIQLLDVEITYPQEEKNLYHYSSNAVGNSILHSMLS